MRDYILAGGVFALGFLAGVLCLRKTLNEKYRSVAREEINSVKEKFKSHEKAVAGEAEKARELYSGVASTDRRDADEPYAISPEEFGEREGYSMMSLLYFTDGVLTDEDCHPVENARDWIGRDTLTRFGEDGEDALYMRNDARKCDYEILLDLRTYADVARTLPPSVGNG